MSEQAELAFVKNFANNLSSQPVNYDDDFQPPPDNWLKRIPPLQVPLPPPPERKKDEHTSVESISVTIKSTKPAQTYNLSVVPTDTIATIKGQLAGVSGAPPADVQRLLLKGKALTDSKLLKEYDIKDGDTINLMVKPGFQWNPTAALAPLITNVVTPPPPPASPPPQHELFTPQSVSPGAGGESITLIPAPKETRSRHGRIPSVVLSPSPSLTASVEERLVDIPLVLDTSSIPTSPSATGASDTPYHTIISQPEFWQRLHAFLKVEFPNASDAAAAWEDFFVASKGTLSVSEIAKIRDKVGVIGMAGN